MFGTLINHTVIFRDWVFYLLTYWYANLIYFYFSNERYYVVDNDVTISIIFLSHKKKMMHKQITLYYYLSFRLSLHFLPYALSIHLIYESYAYIEKKIVCLKSYPVHFDFLSFICLFNIETGSVTLKLDLEKIIKNQEKQREIPIT